MTGERSGATPAARRSAVGAGCGIAVLTAVVLAAGAVGFVVFAVSNMDRGLHDDPGPPAPRTQIVVDAPRAGGAWWDGAQRFALRDPGGRIAVAGPLERGTSLVVDTPLDPGVWQLDVVTYACSTDGTCGPPQRDGTPADTPPAGSCSAPLVVVRTDARYLVEVRSEGDAAITCTGAPTEEEPELTVPPEWTLRDPRPWGCGSAAWDINTDVGPADREAALDTLDCFQAAVVDGRPVEMPVQETLPADGTSRALWRFDNPAPRPIEVLREGAGISPRRWFRTGCRDLVVDAAEDSTIVGARLTGCAPGRAMALDLPALPSGEAAPSATEARPLAVVIDAPDLDTDAALHRWELHVDGREVAGQPIEIGTALVADVLVLPGSEVSLGWTRYPCPERCSGIDGDGRAADGAGGDGTFCVGDVRDDPVVVVHLAGERCTITGRDEVPPLTVPPEWSLRSTATEVCTGGVDRDRVAIEDCVAEEVADDRVVEWIEPGDGGDPTTIGRWEPPGRLTLFHVDDATWSVERCTGVDPRALGGTGCGSVEPASVDPP
ncbi:MAG TPA: hypothetical protein VF228_03785 [Iamia sp.]